MAEKRSWISSRARLSEIDLEMVSVSNDKACRSRIAGSRCRNPRDSTRSKRRILLLPHLLQPTLSIPLSGSSSLDGWENRRRRRKLTSTSSVSSLSQQIALSSFPEFASLGSARVTSRTLSPSTTLPTLSIGSTSLTSRTPTSRLGSLDTKRTHQHG